MMVPLGFGISKYQGPPSVSVVSGEYIGDRDFLTVILGKNLARWTLLLKYYCFNEESNNIAQITRTKQ